MWLFNFNTILNTCFKYLLRKTEKLLTLLFEISHWDPINYLNIEPMQFQSSHSDLLLEIDVSKKYWKHLKYPRKSPYSELHEEVLQLYKNTNSLMGPFQGYPVVVQFSSFHCCFNGRHRLVLKNIWNHTYSNKLRKILLILDLQNWYSEKTNQKVQSKATQLQSKIRFGGSIFNEKWYVFHSEWLIKAR